MRRLLLIAVLIFGLTGSAEAVNLVATVTGNLTTAGTWVTANTGTNAVLITGSGASSTALTTGNLDSATFVLAAQASQYIAIRVASRATGSPSNKMTIILRNSTGATDVWTFRINVSDIPVCNTTNDQCGWVIFKAAASHTPNGTDSYVVRATLDSTSTAVSLSTNGTANNWQRQVFRTNTAAPAAGDDMLIGGVWNDSNPATKTDVTVTQDSTASTDYGSNQTGTSNVTVAALNIVKGGTLASAITASTNYILRLSGHLVIYSGGTLTQGTSGAKSPRTGSTYIDFDCANNEDFGLIVKDGSTWDAVAESRLSGVTDTTVLLTANASAAATSLTTSAQLSAANGDTIVIASSTRTRSQTETATLNSDAGATSLSLSAGITNAHGGVSPVQAEVCNLTRTTGIRSVTSNKYTFVVMDGATPTVDLQWAVLQGVGGGGISRRGFQVATSAGASVSVTKSVFKEGQIGVALGPAFLGGDLTFTDNVLYNFTTTVMELQGLGAGTVMTGNTLFGGSGSIGIWFQTLTPLWTTWSDTRIIGANIGFQTQINYSFTNPTLGALTIHSCSSYGMNISSAWVSLTFSSVTIWRNNDAGILFAVRCYGLTFSAVTIFGNANQNLYINVSANGGGHIRVMNGVIAGDSTFSTPYGLMIGDSSVTSDWEFDNVDFGASSGVYANHTSGDIGANISGVFTYFTGVFNNVTLRSTETAFNAAQSVFMPGTYLAFTNYDGLSTSHRTLVRPGTVTYETSTVDVSPSIKLTPLLSTEKLDTAGGIQGKGFLVPVTSGQTPTISVKVQKDGSYNGNAPRLILKANPGIGVTTDTVIATFSGGSGSWQTVSGATAAATADGVMEFVVDCDGTAGNIFVDTMTATGSAALTGDMKFWAGGHAVERGSAATAGTQFWAGGLPLVLGLANLSGGGFSPFVVF